MTNTPDHSPASISMPLLVGRQRELARLRDHLRAVLDARGGLVLIGGAAGIGKSALARAIGGEAAAQDVLVLTGRCYDLAETPPYGPWREILADAPGVCGITLPAPFRAAPPTDDPPNQMALFALVRDFLTALAARQPLLLVLEDLHWADPASLDLLRFLCRSQRAMPLLLLGLYRGDELVRARPLYQVFPELVREADATRMDLAPLTGDAIRALVRARYALAAADERRLATYLTVRSEGNALFCVELMRALEEEGFLRPDDSGWTLGDLTRARVPLLLRQVIDRRLMRLGGEAEQVLSLAAVIGQDVPLALWQAVSGVSEEMMLDRVERAVAARVLDETADGKAVRFTHALIREVLYEALLAPRRRAWHRRIAEAMAVRPQSDPHAVAHHFHAAGDARAGAWLVRAGEEAQRTYAWITAAQRYEEALALLPDSDANAGARGWLHFFLGRMRQYIGAGRDLVHLDAAIGLAERANNHPLAAIARLYRGVSLFGGGDVPGAIAEMRAVRAALAALSVAERGVLEERRQLIGGTPDVEQATGILAWFLAHAGFYAEARALTEGAASGEAATEGNALLARTLICAGLGMPGAAREAAASARRAFAAIGAFNEVAIVLWIEQSWVIATYGPDHPEERERARAAVAAIWEKSIAASLSGIPIAIMHLMFAGIEGRWREVRALARQFPLGSVTVEMIPRTVLGQVAFAQGENDLVLDLVREVLPDGPATEPGRSSFLMAMALQRLAAAVAVDTGDLDTARAWLVAHDRWLAGSGTVLGQADGQLGWAAYFRAAGDPRRAVARATLARAHAADPRQPLALLAAHRLLGELATEAGTVADATRHLDASLALADACNAPYDRARTLLALAELRAAMGRPSEARHDLDAAGALCIPLDAKPALARIAALADRLANAKAAPPRFPAGLTAREVEVLQLVAAGLTDSQVAERLHLSPRTVGRHLTGIYRKLGVASRAGATRFAVEHRLT